MNSLLIDWTILERSWEKPAESRSGASVEVARPVKAKAVKYRECGDLRSWWDDPRDQEQDVTDHDQMSVVKSANVCSLIKE